MRSNGPRDRHFDLQFTPLSLLLLLLRRREDDYAGVASSFYGVIFDGQTDR